LILDEQNYQIFCTHLPTSLENLTKRTEKETEKKTKIKMKFQKPERVLL